MRKFLVAIDLNDVLILGGLGLLGYGLAQVSIVIAAQVIGGLLLAIGLIGAWRKGTQGPAREEESPMRSEQS